MALCACPRQDDEILTAPLCPVTSAVGVTSTVLFVEPPKMLFCTECKSYGNSKYCNCKHRLQVYRTYAI